MRVQVTPERVELSEDNAVEVMVTVHNTGDLIGGYHLRVLGADPTWVTLETENLSLFPDMSQSVRAEVLIPPGVSAGERRIAVQVRELTAPQAIAIVEIELVVPPVEALELILTPMTVIGGKYGTFGVIAHNTGNVPVEAALAGNDAEDLLRFDFAPPVLTLAPGDQAIADLRVQGPRRWFGSPVVRAFGIGLLPDRQDLPDAPAALGPPPDVSAAAGPAPADSLAAATSSVAEATSGKPFASDDPLATGTLLQKPRLSRGALSLLSLLLAVTVFATVLSIAFGAMAGQSAKDRNLAIAVAAVRNSGAALGTSSLGGTVVDLANGAPVGGVAIELFEAQTTTTPVDQTATKADGSWNFDKLPSGSYKFRVSGAGFVQIWYPESLTAADATEITLQAGQAVAVQVTLGGLPASVAGEVIGTDVAGAVLTVQVPVESPPADAVGSTPPDQSAGSEPAGAVLQTVPIGSDGKFEIGDLPSPRVYDLVVTKQGFATEQQRIDLAAGENRTGVQLRLRTGDGVISGTVTGPDGPLGGAVITATTGTVTVQTVSLTVGEVGSYTVRGLVTPATYSVTVTAPGFSAQTSTVSLADGQKLTGVALTLARSSGSLSGTVTTVPGGAPAPGVTVSVTSGATSVQTVTQSTGSVGSWTVAGLPIPNTYTITYSRPDLQPQTVAVTLDAAGNLASGSGGADNSIAVAMTSAFAEISGVVTQRLPDGSTQPVGEALVNLTSGPDTYEVTTASQPPAAIGAYRIGGVQPGTYTMSVSSRGTRPTTAIVTVVAGQELQLDPVLIPPASITGTITNLSPGGTVAGLQVNLFRASQYPAEIAQSTTTDFAGAYAFAEVDAPQAYVIEVRSSTLGALGSSTLVLGASEAAVLDITVGQAPNAPTPVPPVDPAPAAPGGGG